MCSAIFTTNTQHNEYVIITSKRRFDVIITCLSRFLFAGLYINGNNDVMRYVFYSQYKTGK